MVCDLSQHPALLPYIATFDIPTAISALIEGPRFDDVVEKILVEDTNKRDPVYTAAQQYLKEFSPETPLAFARDAISLLYRIGSIGIRVNASDKVVYSHTDLGSIQPNEIGRDAEIRIHPMYMLALKGTPRNEAQDED